MTDTTPPHPTPKKNQNKTTTEMNGDIEGIE